MPFTRGPDGTPIPHTATTGSKRSASDALEIPGPRSRQATPAAARIRGSSPDKHVTFGRRLVRGPSPAYSRGSAPSKYAVRPAIVGRAGRDDSSDDTFDPSDDDGPSQQIRLEAEDSSSVRNARNSQRKGRTKRTTSGDLRPMPITSEYQQLNQLEVQLQLKDIINETYRDYAVCGRVHDLRARIVDLAHAFVHDTPPSSLPSQEESLNSIIQDVRNAQLVRYIGCLAQGGPNRERSWQEMLADGESRIALVVGIIGTALKEHVFSELWFGGTSEQIDELEKLQEKQKHGDGYERIKSRAKICNTNRFDISVGNAEAARKVALSLKKLLSPLYRMGQKSIREIPQDLTNIMIEIITAAGSLSREMRQCGDVIYHWPPTFKDEEFDPGRMECINIHSMIKNSPFEKKLLDGHETSVLREPTENCEAIVKVVTFPGLVVHRQGGGALAKRLMEEEKHDDQHPTAPPDVMRSRRMAADAASKLTGDEGYRTRVLCKSVVHLIWGRQRLLTREAGTSAHLDAVRDGKEEKYVDDRKGWVELYDYFLEVNADASRALI